MTARVRGWIALAGVGTAVLWSLLLPRPITPGHFDTLRTPLDEYIWPTDASRRVTSTFGEFRQTHFHAGIDISTNNLTGYAVVAARDGFVWRIRITPGGYGKMLWVKHQDGFVTTYSHLSKFAPRIEEHTRSEQRRLERYPVDLILDPAVFPVKQGELIAYTGNTGSGGPHLHFEIRDENLNPLNPLVVERISAIDNIPPTVRAIALRPFHPNATVQHRDQPLIIRDFIRRGSLYRVPQTPLVTGAVGFSIDARDGADGVWHHVGIHRMDFFLNDSLIFSAQFDRINANQSKEILLHYDFELLQQHGRFQKLYVEEAISQPIYEGRTSGEGLIDSDVLREGLHEYRIVVKDLSGNTSEVVGDLLLSHRPAIVFNSVDHGSIQLAIKNVSTIREIIFGSLIPKDLSWNFTRLRPDEMQREGNLIRLQMDTSPFSGFQASVTNEWGITSPPTLHFTQGLLTGNTPVHFTVEIRPEYVTASLTTDGMFTSRPEVTVFREKGPARIPMTPVNAGHYRGYYIPVQSSNTPLLFAASGTSNGSSFAATEPTETFVVSPHEAGWISFDRGNVVLVYDSGAVYRPLLVTITRVEEDGTPIYRLAPRNRILKGGIRVFVRSELAPGAPTGIYLRSQHSWDLRPSTYNHQTEFYTTTLTRTLGDIAVMRDTTPPVISPPSIPVRGGRPTITFGLYDDLSGIDADEVKIYLNGVFVIPEISEGWSVYGQTEEPLPRGQYTASIRAKDRAGNPRVVERTLIVP